MRGGKRPNAGRPKGAVSEKTKQRLAIAEKAAAQGVTPLEVMLTTMRDRWAAGDKDGAMAAAEKAAPYVHPKLASIEQKVDADVRQRVVSAEPITDDEWEKRYGNSVGAPTGTAEGSC